MWNINKMIKLNHLFLTTFILIINIVVVNAQSVIITNNGVLYDNKPLLMEGVFDEWTNSQYVQFVNKSDGNVYLQAHIHHHLSFIYFVDSDNHAGNSFSTSIPSGSKYSLRVISKLESGSPIIYNDQLGIDISYQDGHSDYFELKASVYFHNKNDVLTASEIARPNRYGYIGYGFKEVSTGKPMRWHTTDFPLVVYSNHTAFGYSEAYSAVIQKAMNVWNNAGISIGLNTTIFELSDNQSDVDIKMDWSGAFVPEGKLGVAMPGSKIVGMLPLHNYDGLGAAGETLLQELGHLLGPVHSDVRYDVMNGTAHGHWHDLTQIELTERDRQMLGWLYTQNDYHPFEN